MGREDGNDLQRGRLKASAAEAADAHGRLPAVRGIENERPEQTRWRPARIIERAQIAEGGGTHRGRISLPGLGRCRSSRFDGHQRGIVAGNRDPSRIVPETRSKTLGERQELGVGGIEKHGGDAVEPLAKVSRLSLLFRQVGEERIESLDRERIAPEIRARHTGAAENGQHLRPVEIEHGQDDGDLPNLRRGGPGHLFGVFVFLENVIFGVDPESLGGAAETFLDRAAVTVVGHQDGGALLGPARRIDRRPAFRPARCS